jgi:hypothetical protein
MARAIHKPENYAMNIVFCGDDAFNDHPKTFTIRFYGRTEQPNTRKSLGAAPETKSPG